MRYWPTAPAARALVLSGLALGCSPTLADVYHLQNGRAIEAELLEFDGSMYRLRAVSGVVSLPASAVVRVEPAPSPFAEYARRAADTPNSAAGQFGLAQWCAEREMLTEQRAHLQRVLLLDADHADARRLLGFVRVGSLWVEARSVIRAREPAADAAKDAARVAEALQSEWRRRIRALRIQHLESPHENKVAEGRTRLLEIRDPLAILPLTQVLSKGRPLAREVLADALARFAEDEATLNLAVMALSDADDGVRRRCQQHLKTRADGRVLGQWRLALRSDNELLVRRAAAAVGEVAAKEAVPDLIAVLTARREKWVEVPIRTYFAELPAAFSGTSIELGGSDGLLLPPIIGVSGVADGIENEWRLREVTVYRTEVLEALKRITGQNFGFDRTEWSRWYEEQRS